MLRQGKEAVAVVLVGADVVTRWLAAEIHAVAPGQVDVVM